MKERIELEFPSDTSYLYKIREFVRNHALRAGFSEDDIDKIELAVDELCSNVIEHAYDMKEGEFKVILEANAYQFKIQVIDQGKPFPEEKLEELSSKPDIEKYVKERRSGGLGLYIMKQLMDSVEYRRDPRLGNVWTMVKRINK